MSLKKSFGWMVLTGAAITLPLLLPVPSSLRTVPTLLADSVTCDLAQYKAAPGLTAAMERDVLAVTWNGQTGTEMRARYAIDGGQPVIRELAIRKSGGQWANLGRNLTPEYHVVTGIRRLGQDQAAPLRRSG